MSSTSANGEQRESEVPDVITFRKLIIAGAVLLFISLVPSYVLVMFPSLSWPSVNLFRLFNWVFISLPFTTGYVMVSISFSLLMRKAGGHWLYFFVFAAGVAVGLQMLVGLASEALFAYKNTHLIFLTAALSIVNAIAITLPLILSFFIRPAKLRVPGVQVMTVTLILMSLSQVGSLFGFSGDRTAIAISSTIAGIVTHLSIAVFLVFGIRLKKFIRTLSGTSIDRDNG